MRVTSTVNRVVVGSNPTIRKYVAQLVERLVLLLIVTEDYLCMAKYLVTLVV